MLLGPIDVIFLSKRALLLFHWLVMTSLLPVEEEEREKGEDGEECTAC